MVGPELSGKLVKLRPLRFDDLFRRTEWLNDEETVRLFTGLPPSRAYTITDAQRWRQGVESDPASVAWAIESDSGRHIGDVDLHGIDRESGSAKLTILIGDKAHWDHGYGTDTIKTLLRHAFNDMHLAEVNLRVYDFNGRGIHCYENCGFRRTGLAVLGKAGPGEIYMTADKGSLTAE